MLKKLEEDKDYILRIEEQNKVAVSTVEKETHNVVFADKTEYSFAETEERLMKVISDITELRHAVNVVNSSVKIGTDCGDMTVDQILVMLPQLTERQEIKVDDVGGA